MMAQRFGHQAFMRHSAESMWNAALRSSPLVAVGVLHFSNGTRMTRSRNEGNPKGNGDEDKSSSSPRLLLDVTKQWNTAKDYLEQNIFTDHDNSRENEKAAPKSDEKSSSKSGSLSMLSSILPGKGENKHGHSDEDERNHEKESQETERNLKGMRSSLLGLLTGQRSSERTLDDLISKARRSSEQGDVSDSVSLEELLSLLRTVSDEFGQTIEKHLDGKHLPVILPTNLYYFLEYEDERKNFSWRRRKHRFCRGIDLEYVNELNSYMRIAEIGYSDEMETIQKELSEIFGYEVIYCQMDSLPSQPSHFLAVKKDQSQWSSSLDMLMCVRGTKTITDVITDLLADAVDYRDGNAHSGILKSGKWLAQKHMNTFKEFLEASGKKKINLTIVGHSLGAGAASIAGMELQEHENFDVQVVGFGCPALLSKELSESTQGYITTIVSDNDCIPRMSLANMINTLLDIGEYDWTPRAKQDLEDVVNQVQSALPSYISDSVKERILDALSSKVLSAIDIPPPTKERMETVLFPPGKCIHFYRDGYGLSGAVVPCTFFDSIDVNRRMVDDHSFDTGYRLVFLDLMRQYKGDHYFQFEIKK